MNLRKDHCRNLPSRKTREHVATLEEGRGARARPRPSSPGARGPARCPRHQTNPGAECVKERQRDDPCHRGAPEAVTRPRWLLRDWSECRKRLSATDISALASMKNVAKCDTWCELQNPVNHRVFERKLRPKPSGRGHVCLGVTHRRPPRIPFPLLAGRAGTVGGGQ